VEPDQERRDAVPLRTRAEPPPFRRVSVARTEERTPFLRRVTLRGDELRGMACDEPGASVRLLLPDPRTGELVLPTWNGNEFLASDGSRPSLRTLTPLELRDRTGETPELDLDIVLHDHGALTDWARGVTEHAPAAVSGPGRGYAVDPHATSFLLVGDESAAPAISTILDVLPEGARALVLVEVHHPDATLDWATPTGVEVRTLVRAAGAPLGEATLDVVRGLELTPGTRVWGAGEAAAMQRLRRHLFEDRDLPRSHAVVRGYWKVDRTPRDQAGRGATAGPD
jgi:NADPH-dependent ferric siderophore reductase